MMFSITYLILYVAYYNITRDGTMFDVVWC